MNTKSLVVSALVLMTLFIRHEGLAQTSIVPWSSFNMGFAVPASANTAVKSAVGQAFVGTIQNANTRIESGFFIAPLVSGPTAVDENKEEGIPSTYELQQNYPNPFNPGTTIQFALPKASSVTLKLYDLLGREVATLVDGKLPPGVHKVIFDSRKLASGVYFYRLRADDFSQTRRLMLLR